MPVIVRAASVRASLARVVLAAAVLACPLRGAFLFASPEASPEAPAVKGSAYSSLREDELFMRTALAGPDYYLGFGLDAQGEGTERGICLGLGSLEVGRLGIVAGQGSLSGSARVLVDPTSPTALVREGPVELDKSLESKSSVLGLRAGALSLFALARKSGTPARVGAAAAGLGCDLGGEEGGLSLLAAASRDGSPPESSGWRPDFLGAPAANPVDGEGPCLGAALVAERRGEGGAAIAALAASYGRLSGPGLAFRLESRASRGPFSARLCAGAADSAFRQLAGGPGERLLGASAEARLAMRHASSISAWIEAEAIGSSLFYAPLWGRKGGAKLGFPVSGGSRSFETSVEVDSPPEGSRGASASIALARRLRSSVGSSSSRLGASLHWASVLEGLEIGLETELSGRRGLPALGLDLKLEALGGGSPDSPVRAKGGASLELPFGPAASLELDLDLPEKGVVLAPWPDSAAGSSDSEPRGPVLGLRYRASFSANGKL